MCAAIICVIRAIRGFKSKFMVKLKSYVYVQEPQEVENHRTVRHHCPHRHRQFLPHPELQKLGHTDPTDPTDNHVAADCTDSRQITLISIDKNL